MYLRESYISANSDYILLRSDFSYRLFLGEKIIWNKSFEDHTFMVLALGNNGTILARENKRAFLLHRDGEKEPIMEECDEDAESVTINKIVMDGQGRVICLENEVKQNPTGKKKSGFFFKSKEVEDPMRYHRIQLIDTLNREENEIWDYERDTQNEGEIKWDISRDLNMLAVAETSWQEKPAMSKITRIYLIDIRQDKSILQLNLSNVIVNRILVNDKSAVLLDVNDEGQHQFMIIQAGIEKKFINTPVRKDATVAHFGNDVVVLKVAAEGIYLFKDFDDKLVYMLDERAVEAAGIEYPFIFKSNDDIIFSSFDEKRLVLTRHNYCWRGNKIDFIYHK